MDIAKAAPVILYDNECYLCAKFAGAIRFLAGAKFTIIGHYTDSGKEIRDEILDESALEMFWFIDERRASGGRAALLPMIRAMIFGGSKERPVQHASESCGEECRTVRAVFVRSASIITNSRRIDLHGKSK